MIWKETSIFLTKKIINLFLKGQWTKLKLIESNLKEVTYKNFREISFFCDDIVFLVCAEQKRKLEKFWIIW